MKNTYYPTIIEKGDDLSEKGLDVISKLLQNRIVFLNSEIDDEVAGSIVAQLLYLEAADEEKDIFFYINSPGGVITSGMAIYDTMQFIKPRVITICLGQACSMGAFLLSAGAERKSLPNARIMIHQPLGGSQGQQTDIEIHAKEIKKLRDLLEKIMSDNTKGKTTLAKMHKICERDNFLSAGQALDLGLIDEIVTKR